MVRSSMVLSFEPHGSTQVMPLPAGEMCAIRPLPPARLAAVPPASLAFQDELHTEVHLPAPTYVVVPTKFPRPESSRTALL